MLSCNFVKFNSLFLTVLKHSQCASMMIEAVLPPIFYEALKSLGEAVLGIDNCSQQFDYILPNCFPE